VTAATIAITDPPIAPEAIGGPTIPELINIWCSLSGNVRQLR
jgi:hypothetical protein